ncbi:MAG: hypothetical protein F9K40_02975 [Kofleriaceae bacterium]|nr:MAG: hypothetical protein F9K40_02975 [Kofleriaceae bacterium]
MANLHLLANRPAMTRLTSVDSLIAASTDGSDAVADSLRRLNLLGGALAHELAVIVATDVRIQRRPPVPPPATLQDLVRSGRRRLERERLGRRRTWHADRMAAVGRLRAALEP